jgi:prepilin-type processing-associated H-X9-DG protein
MNGQMGAYSVSGFTFPNYNTGYRLFNRVSQLIAPIPPSLAFIFLEEHPGSINDGYFQVDMINAIFPDMPGSNHGSKGSFSFADGHAELHKWLNPNTVKPVVAGITVQLVQAGLANKDLDWLRSVTTFKQ